MLFKFDIDFFLCVIFINPEIIIFGFFKIFFNFFICRHFLSFKTKLKMIKEAVQKMYKSTMKKVKSSLKTSSKPRQKNPVN